MTNSIRLNKVIKELMWDCRPSWSFAVKRNYGGSQSSEKITGEQYDLLKKEYGADKELRGEVDKQKQDRQKEKNQGTQKARPPGAKMIKTEIPESMRPQNQKPKGILTLTLGLMP